MVGLGLVMGQGGKGEARLGERWLWAWPEGKGARGRLWVGWVRGVTMVVPVGWDQWLHDGTRGSGKAGTLGHGWADEPSRE